VNVLFKKIALVVFVGLIGLSIVVQAGLLGAAIGAGIGGIIGGWGGAAVGAVIGSNFGNSTSYYTSPSYRYYNSYQTQQLAPFDPTPAEIGGFSILKLSLGDDELLKLIEANQKDLNGKKPELENLGHIEDASFPNEWICLSYCGGIDLKTGHLVSSTIVSHGQTRDSAFNGLWQSCKEQILFVGVTSRASRSGKIWQWLIPANPHPQVEGAADDDTCQAPVK
jgi:hypothetical protein